MVVMAVPSFALREISRGVAPYLEEKTVMVSVTKGLEQDTLLPMSQIVAQETGHCTVALTGPSHAEEVAILPFVTAAEYIPFALTSCAWLYFGSAVALSLHR